MRHIFRMSARARTYFIAAAILVGGFFLYRVFAAPSDTPDFVTAIATKGNIERNVIATGTLEPAALVSVGAQASGRIETLAVSLGQTVKAGDLIAQIDSQTQTNALKTAEADLANRQAQRAAKLSAQSQAELAFKRQVAMGAGEATSFADYEAAKATLASSRADVAALDANIDVAKVSVDTARVNLGYTRIVAPIEGVVVSIVTKQGQTVNALQSAPTIVILAKLDVMTVKAEISEADVIKLSAGQEVYFTILGDPDHPYYATLRQIEPAPESIVDEVNSTSSSSTASSTAIYYNALFDVPNTDGRLRPLMTAQVSVVLESAKDVLLIPSAALGARGADGQYAVRVVGEDGNAQERLVRVGINTNVSAQVIEGLEAGDKVVVAEASQETSATQLRGGPPMGL